jgi:hypothetical protein
MPKTIIAGKLRADRILPTFSALAAGAGVANLAMDLNLHSLPRQLIELRIEHADLDNLIDRAVIDRPLDELSLRRLKKRRLLLRDRIARLESEVEPPQPA